MIDFYYWTSPNAHKVTIMLEEVGLPYDLKVINIRQGAQFHPSFLTVSPNNRIPAIVDHDPPVVGNPLPIFESGAILLYLAEKTGRFTASTAAGRSAIHQWLFWQVGGVGPMIGQFVHFKNYAAEHVGYAIDRYERESDRLLGVLERQLAQTEYVAGADYSIAEMAIYPWTVTLARIRPFGDEFAHVRRWMGRISQRPATISAYALAETVNPSSGPVVHSEEERTLLFGQTSKTVRDVQAKLAG